MKTMINSVSPFSVVIETRQRKAFPADANEKLRNSIRKNGLFHAIGLRSIKDPTLVYGHRRFLALKSLIEDGTLIHYNGKDFNGEIPFVAVGDLSPLQLQEIELSENIDRLDLTWQEKAQTIASLEDIRNAQREDVASVTDSPFRPITLKELAHETKQSIAPISEALAIAKHLSDPEVAKAKNQKEAKKIIERKAKAAYAKERADTFSPSASMHTFIQGDSCEVIKTLPSSSFDAIITDPPYGISMDKEHLWGGSWHEYDDSEAYCFNLIETLLPEWDRVTKDQAHLYLFCDFSKFFIIKKIIEDYTEASGGDFKVLPFPFIWDKGNVASYANSSFFPRKSYECIIYVVKGEKPHNKLDLAVISIPQTQHHDHPAGKPTSLYAHLLSRSLLAGDTVLDCFAGQGTIFQAASSCDVVATGIELNPHYADLALNTLHDLGE